MATRQQRSREHARILQDNCCIYCGQQMLPTSRPGPRQCTAEHLQPRSEGGGCSRDNIRRGLQGLQSGATPAKAKALILAAAGGASDRATHFSLGAAFLRVLVTEWLFKPAALASSGVNSWASPLAWLALPPMLAIRCRCSADIDAKPRRDLGLVGVSSVLMRSS